MKKAMSKKEKKAAINQMTKEIMEILTTMDFSNYKIYVYYDEDTNTTIVPKPVYALTFVDSDLREWVFQQIEMHSGCVVRFQ